MDGKDWVSLIVGGVAGYYIVKHYFMTGKPA